MEHEAYRCDRCGTFPDEYLDEEGKRRDPPPYVPEAIRCYGCVALERDNEEARKQDITGGLHIRLVTNRNSEAQDAE